MSSASYKALVRSRRERGLCYRCGKPSGIRYRCAKCRGLDAAWRIGRKGELSPQQRKVMRLKREGRSNEAIAERLGIKVSTVEAQYKLANGRNTYIFSEAEIDMLQHEYRLAHTAAK